MNVDLRRRRSHGRLSRIQRGKEEGEQGGGGEKRGETVH